MKKNRLVVFTDVRLRAVLGARADALIVIRQLSKDLKDLISGNGLPELQGKNI